MPFIVTQLPWLIVWIVALLLQEGFIRKKNWFGSLLIIWVVLIISFIWDPAVNLLAADLAEKMQFGSRFWLLFVIAAILHVLGRRREKKQEQPKPEEPEEK